MNYAPMWQCIFLYLLLKLISPVMSNGSCLTDAHCSNMAKCNPELRRCVCKSGYNYELKTNRCEKRKEHGDKCLFEYDCIQQLGCYDGKCQCFYHWQTFNGKHCVYGKTKNKSNEEGEFNFTKQVFFPVLFVMGIIMMAALFGCTFGNYQMSAERHRLYTSSMNRCNTSASTDRSNGESGSRYNFLTSRRLTDTFPDSSSEPISTVSGRMEQATTFHRNYAARNQGENSLPTLPPTPPSSSPPSSPIDRISAYNSLLDSVSRIENVQQLLHSNSSNDIRQPVDQLNTELRSTTENQPVHVPLRHSRLNFQRENSNDDYVAPSGNREFLTRLDSIWFSEIDIRPPLASMESTDDYDGEEIARASSLREYNEFNPSACPDPPEYDTLPPPGYEEATSNSTFDISRHYNPHRY